jgi:hypothetical protein
MSNRRMSADEVVMFSLDDEDISTDLEHEPWSGGTSGSFVGVLPQEDGARLATVVARIEQACNAFDSTDPSAEAAELSLRRRVGSLALASNALTHVCAFITSSTHRELFMRETGLVEPYLGSVAMWTGDVAETLEHLATELNELAPNWAAFRECMSNVEWVYARVEGERVRLERVADTLPDDVRAAVMELIAAVTSFKRAVDEPFG